MPFGYRNQGVEGFGNALTREIITHILVHSRTTGNIGKHNDTLDGLSPHLHFIHARGSGLKQRFSSSLILVQRGYANPAINYPGFQHNYDRSSAIYF
jgi:hypothetical protein